MERIQTRMSLIVLANNRSCLRMGYMKWDAPVDVHVLHAEHMSLQRISPHVQEGLLARVELRVP